MQHTRASIGDKETFALLCLAPDRVYPRHNIAIARRVLLPPVFTLTQVFIKNIRRLFSVALSMGLRPP